MFLVFFGLGLAKIDELDPRVCISIHHRGEAKGKAGSEPHLAWVLSDGVRPRDEGGRAEQITPATSPTRMFAPSFVE